MKYYSEVLHKNFDTVKELEAAEKAEAKKQEEAKEELVKVTNEKKAMAKKVEDASEALQEAYNKYDLAKEDVAKIIAEAKLEIEEILKPAKEAIKEAQKNRYDAIAEFSNKYGKYSVVYTGDKAYQEMQRARRYMDNIFKNSFFDIWW